MTWHTAEIDSAHTNHVETTNYVQLCIRIKDISSFL